MFEKHLTTRSEVRRSRRNQPSDCSLQQTSVWPSGTRPAVGPFDAHRLSWLAVWRLAIRAIAHPEALTIEAMPALKVAPSERCVIGVVIIPRYKPMSVECLQHGRIGSHHIRPSRGRPSGQEWWTADLEPSGRWIPTCKSWANARSQGGHRKAAGSDGCSSPGHVQSEA